MKTAIPISQENNPLWPLPVDYSSLSIEGKRRARVNAASYFLCPTNDPNTRASNLVASVNFFDRTYLVPDERAGFYDLKPLPSPAFHNDILWGIGRYRRTVTAAPRGYAKSNLIRKLMLTVCTAQPNFGFFYATSSDKMVKLTMRTLFRAWTENTLLLSDFSREPEFGGSIRPPRGNPFGLEFITLSNGSSVFATSAKSRNRGGRPIRFILDDPEYDPDRTTNMLDLREWMEELLFKIVGPMIELPGRGIDWFGTIISQQHYLQVPFIDHLTGELEDMRFKEWRRMRFQMAYPSMDDPQWFLWPDLHGPEDLKRLIRTYGPDYVLAEFFNLPPENNSFAFNLDESNHSWRLTHLENTVSNPLIVPYNTTAHIEYKSQTGSIVSKSLPKFLATSPVCMTVDWALSLSTTADYSAVAVMAITPENELFILDLLVARLREDDLAREILRLNDIWRPRVIGIEEPTLYSNIKHKVDTASLHIQHKPFIKTLKHFDTSKASRIMGLKHRFGFDDSREHHGLIKLPFFKRQDPSFKQLFYQINAFNPASVDGGLRHDDAIDAVSMAQDIIAGLPSRSLEAQRPPSIKEQLLSGKLHDSAGNPLIGLLSPGELSVSEFGKILARTKMGGPTPAIPATSWEQWNAPTINGVPAPPPTGIRI